jgi:hypothetical protein
MIWFKFLVLAGRYDLKIKPLYSKEGNVLVQVIGTKGIPAYVAIVRGNVYAVFKVTDVTIKSDEDLIRFENDYCKKFAQLSQRAQLFERALAVVNKKSDIVNPESIVYLDPDGRVRVLKSGIEHLEGV